MRTVFIMIPILLLASCGGERCRTSVIEPAGVELVIENLGDKLFEANSAAEIDQILNDQKEFALYFLDVDQYPSSGILAERIFRLAQNPSMDTLYQEASLAFEDLSQFREDMTDALGRMKGLFPNADIPKIQLVVTGLYKDLYISEDLIIIGTDFFVGPEASYPPMDIPDYILRRYNKEQLPVTLMKFISGSYVMKGKGETLLSEMIDFGKTYYLLSRLMPCTPDDLIIEFTAKEMETVKENEPVIWANFVENEILYETSHFTKKKFLGERPNVYEISKECPGRVGAWVGWQIVEAYMKNNDVNMHSLLQDRDHDKIFRKSGYKPKG